LITGSTQAGDSGRGRAGARQWLPTVFSYRYVPRAPVLRRRVERAAEIPQPGHEADRPAVRNRAGSDGTSETSEWVTQDRIFDRHEAPGGRVTR
jgi:hypothetical protein